MRLKVRFLMNENETTYNAKTESVLRKLQLEELDILNVFSDFCKKRNLVWFLDSGTALGAMRHNGFIPWDDDIDVGMPRDDYNKLITFAQENGRIAPGFSVHTFNNTDNYAAMFTKIYKDETEFFTEETKAAGCKQGIFIDVFPYDLLPQNPEEAKKRSAKAHRWQMISYLFHSKSPAVPHKGLLGRAEKLICSFLHTAIKAAIPREKIWKEYNKCIGTTMPGDRYIAYAYPVLPGFNQDVLFPTSEHIFEGKLFPIPRDPNRYLAINYGDWQTLPKPEERKTHLPIRLKFSDGTVYSANS